jgi:Domain of unknown function DUF29
MIKQTESPPSLHEKDETAWLELTASLVAEGRFGDIDRSALAEYLTDMAKRDKREVANRLTVLMAHVLKWEHQHKSRSNSWRATIISQQDELEELLESGTLRRYAEEILTKCYSKAVQRTAAETGLPVEKFPEACPYLIDRLLSKTLIHGTR